MLDTSAMERFVEEYGNHAYAFALGLTGNELDARELVQDSFVRIFDRAAQYDASQSLESWFLTVMKNIFRDSRRRAERRLGVSLDTEITDDGLTVADAVADATEEAVLDRLEREEDVARVRRALARLPEDARAILMMVDVEGMTYEKSAEVLGVALGTVRSRMSRARVLLRDRLLAMEVAA
jgi:RNA polymerase sigma-70 factor (ECF subfamily)